MVCKSTKTTENGKFHSLIKPCFAYKQRTIMILAKPQSNDAFFHWIWIAEREIYATTNSLQAIVHLQLKSRTSTFQNATLRKTPHGFVWKTFALALAEKLILRKKILIICNCLNSENNQTFLSCFFVLFMFVGPPSQFSWEPFENSALFQQRFASSIFCRWWRCLGEFLDSSSKIYLFNWF